MSRSSADSGPAAPAVAAPLFKPGRIGSLLVPNRLIRAGTSETLADDRGGVTDQLVALYGELSRNGVGLLFTGHLFCEARGQYARRQTGIHQDALIPGLKRLTDEVHRSGSRIFAQLAHAGSQSRVSTTDAWAPSPVANALTGRPPRAASHEDIEAALSAFADGARRAVEAGFDGLHIHGANGYLVSEFSSPLTNHRVDMWGGTPSRRDRFALEVVRAVRAAVPRTVPVTMKLGMFDAVPGGLELEESIPRARRLIDQGLDALEVSCNVMRAPTDSARQYVAVDRRRSVEDLLLHRVFGSPAQEAYFLPHAQALGPHIDRPLILAGGFRRAATMASILSRGDADFIALARPLIREPDLVTKLRAGLPQAACTSCNLCLMHEGHHGLQCWRVPRRRLLAHALYRLRGGLRTGS